MATKEELRASIPTETIVVDEALATEVAKEVEQPNQLETKPAVENEQVGESVEAEAELDESGNEVDTDEPEVKDEPKISQATFDRRVGKLTAKQKELERQLAEREAELTRLSAKSEDRDLTPQERERQIELKAEQKAAEIAFNSACNNMADMAEREKPGFAARLQALAEDVAPLPKPMIEALLNLENGHSILNHLTENPDDAERIFKLSPIRQIQETTRLSEKLKAKKIKPLSKAPAPITAITGGAKAIAASAPHENMTDEEWFAARQKTKRAPVYR
jgi:hypothetical protein